MDCCFEHECEIPELHPCPPCGRLRVEGFEDGGGARARCGIDISKRDAKVAVRVPGKRAGTFTTTVSTWGATVAQILDLIGFLHARGVTTVVMEAVDSHSSCRILTPVVGRAARRVALLRGGSSLRFKPGGSTGAL